MSLLFGGDLLFSSSKLLTSSTNSHVPYYSHNHQIKTSDIMKNKQPLTSASSALGHSLPEPVYESKIDPLQSEDQYSMAGLRRDILPKHLAISMDGNRRWLKAQNRDLDYMPYLDKQMLFAQLCLKWGIGTATSLVWGIGNFTKRGKEVNDFFFGQVEQSFNDNLETYIREGIKVLVRGETSLLSKSLQATIKQVEEATSHCSNLELYLPVFYTGQRDITEAARKICEKVKEGVIEPHDVNEDEIEKHLSLTYFPPPDLFIRTGGELRIGALLAWRIAHIELYFTDVHAPEFGEGLFLDALRSFPQRNRLFGG